nr:transposase [Salinimicrobium tongyeongense]
MGPPQVVEYLGRYTHKIAISNHRIKNLDNKKVSFLSKITDTAEGNLTRTYQTQSSSDDLHCTCFPEALFGSAITES